MADFHRAHQLVKRAEGGYTDDPRDPGNWTGGRINRGRLVGTMFGIAAPTLKAWRGREITADDMKALTAEEAEAIFRRQYWDAYDYGGLPDQQLAELLYDGTVNQGPGLIRRALLFAFQQLRVVPKVPLLPSLVAQAATLPAAAVHELVWQYRRDRYDPASPFYRGWMKRLERLRREPIT